eukprot:430645-Pelagomonas_calceolata.AAC.1
MLDENVSRASDQPDSRAVGQPLVTPNPHILFKEDSNTRGMPCSCVLAFLRVFSGLVHNCSLASPLLTGFFWTSQALFIIRFIMLKLVLRIPAGHAANKLVEYQIPMQPDNLSWHTPFFSRPGVLEQDVPVTLQIPTSLFCPLALRWSAGPRELLHAR